jgi:hypothetical protein
MQSRALIIAGMHRSGTSLITNWLHHCGMQVGERLVEASDGNKQGHYEDVEFLKIHQEILADNGLPLSGLIYNQKINISAYQLEKLKAVIRIKEERFKQWGWKEPRTCLFLDIYNELLPGVKYFVIMREYLAVVNSLLKRDFDVVDKTYKHRSFFTRLKWNLFRKERRRKKFYRNNAENYLKVWIDYNEHVLSLLQKLPAKDYLVINYSLLEKDDREVFSFLTGKWDFKLDYFPFGKVYDKTLISGQADLKPFLKDTSLEERAKAIENEFKKYMKL